MLKNKTQEQQISTSVLVIGTGGSGLRAAIELAELGVDVLAVGKRPRHDAHTSLAAGGINAALATMDEEDSWQQTRSKRAITSRTHIPLRSLPKVQNKASPTWNATAWVSRVKKMGESRSASLGLIPSAAPHLLVITPD